MKTKADMKKDMIIYNTHPWIMFSASIGFHLESGIRLKLDVQGQGSRQLLDVDGQGGKGS